MPASSGWVKYEARKYINLRRNLKHQDFHLHIYFKTFMMINDRVWMELCWYLLLIDLFLKILGEWEVGAYFLSSCIVKLKCELLLTHSVPIFLSGYTYFLWSLHWIIIFRSTHDQFLFCLSLCYFSNIIILSRSLPK